MSTLTRKFDLSSFPEWKNTQINYSSQTVQSVIFLHDVEKNRAKSLHLSNIREKNFTFYAFVMLTKYYVLFHFWKKNREIWTLFTWGIQACDGPLSNPVSKRNFRAKFRPFSCKDIRSNWFNCRTRLRGGAVPGAPRPLIPAAPLKKFKQTAEPKCKQTKYLDQFFYLPGSWGNHYRIDRRKLSKSRQTIRIVCNRN